MKEPTLQAITPARAMEIAQAAVELMNKLLVTKSQDTAQKIAQDFAKQIPELAAVAELRQALVLGAVQAAMDSTAPLTAQELEGLLQRSGLSQTEMAELLGVAQPMISLWLNGTRPIPQARANAIRQICMTAFANQILAVGTTVFDSPAAQHRGKQR